MRLVLMVGVTLALAAPASAAAVEFHFASDYVFLGVNPDPSATRAPQNADGECVTTSTSGGVAVSTTCNNGGGSETQTVLRVLP